MSTVVGASLLAHGVHIALVLLGLWGLAALLLPHVLDRRGATGGRQYQVHPAHQEHETRVRALRHAVASGSLGTTTAVLERDRVPEPRPDAAAGALALPLAVVASTAAAGIHAAVAPPHLEESLLFGLFFLGAALTQLAWAVAVAVRSSRRLLEVGVAGNAALLVLWAVTRTTGLPWGLLHQPEAVGGWDVACALWEVTVVVTAAWLLRDDVVRRCPTWFAWHPAARGAVGIAGVSLALLALMGTHA